MFDPTKISREQLQVLAIAGEAEQCRRWLYFFVRKAYQAAYSERFIDGWHIAACVYAIQSLWEGTLRTLDDQPADTLVINMPPGVGKALDISTPVLTTWGWKSHGDLSPGDFVFGPDGQPKRVLAVTPHFQEDSHEVSFDDGAAIVAGQHHLWQVERDCFAGGSNSRCRQSTVVKTTQLVESGYKRKKSQQRPDRIPICEPIQLPPKRLLIDPYILGLWLGDGDSKCGHYCVAHEDISELGRHGAVRRTKPPLGNYQAFYHVTIEGLRTKLRILGLIRNKHIPEDYLEASIEQRWELLRGLMDTDGYCVKRSKSGRAGGSCQFSTKLRHLAEQVVRLAASLGLKPHQSEKFSRHRDGRLLGPYFTVIFTPQPGDTVFRLPRKQALVNGNQNPRSRFRYVQSVTPVGSRTVNCITVDGEIYLAGHRLVPTHNSRLTCCLSAAWIWAKSPQSGLWFTSFGQGLCDRDALDTRQLICSDWYRQRFWRDVHLMDDANQKRRYNTNKGGWRLSASIESRVGFGEHPSLLGIDDPHDPEQGLSSTLRQIAIDTWTNKFSTRGIVKGVKKLIVAQRLHEEDLSGYVLANEEGVAHLFLPMEFEPERRCTVKMTYADIDDVDESGEPRIKQEWTDPRTEPGELLWPAGMDAGKVAKLKKRLRRAHAIAGQLQQRPSAPEGDMFREDWLQFVDAAPPCYRAVRGWDKASSTGRRSDFTAGGRILDDGQFFYISHIERGKWEMEKRDKRIHEIADADANIYPDYTVVYEQEGASGGKDAARLAAQQTHALGFKVRIIKAGNVKKEVRWEVLADAMANGLVKIVGQRSDQWVSKFIDELLAAPNGAHDDTIDAVVIPMRYMVEGRGRGRIHRDLLHLTDAEQEQLRSDDAAAGKQLCENCVGLGCPACGHSGFVMAGQSDDLRAIFDAACAGREEAELGVKW